MFMTPSTQNYKKYAKYFPGASLESNKRTFQATTEFGDQRSSKRFQPAETHPGTQSHADYNEDVATNTSYSQTPAINDGSTVAQFFIGSRTITPLGTSDKQMAKTLVDEICKYGSMDRLILDNAKAQISERVKEIQRTFCIKDWQSKPYMGYHNFAERAWKGTKMHTNNLLDMLGSPSKKRIFPKVKMAM